MNADVRALIERAKAHGWVHLPAPTGHQRLRYPPTGDIVVLPSTPSDYRSLLNCEALLRRISGRLSAPPGNGPTKEQREARRRLMRARATAARRRTAARPEPLLPKRTAMEVALDDYCESHHDTELAHEVEHIRRAG